MSDFGDTIVSDIHEFPRYFNQTPMNYSPTIFLVEDDQQDQEIFISALDGIIGDVKLLGVVNNGEEAIDRLRRLPILPQIIFMDINMPIMGGMECLSLINKDPLMKGIPIIILSSDMRHGEKALQGGAFGFIKKQYSVPSLREELEQMFLRFDYIYEGKEEEN